MQIQWNFRQVPGHKLGLKKPFFGYLQFLVGACTWPAGSGVQIQWKLRQVPEPAMGTQV
jgi:hypothetical protein